MERRRGTAGRRIPWKAWLVAAVFPAAGADADVVPSLAVGYEARWTDNVLLAPTEEAAQEDVVHSPLVDIGLLVDQPRTDASVDYQWRGRYFQDDTVRDDNVFTGRSEVRYGLVPGRFEWDASHVRTQQLANIRNVDNPLNQQEFDTFSTGLQYRLPASGPHSAGVSGRASRFSTSGEFGVDSTRYEAAADYSRALGATASLGLFADVLEADFDETLIPAFTRVSGGFTFQRTGPRLQLDGRAGLNRVLRDDLDDTDGFLLNASATLALTDAQSLTLGVQRQLTDQTQFLGAGRLAFGGIRDQGQFGAVFEITSVSARYGYRAGRLQLTLSADARRQEFDDDDFPRSDIERRTFGARIDYGLSSTLNAQFGVSRLENEFGGLGGGLLQDREDEQLRWDGQLRWRLGARTSVSGGFRYIDSQSTAGFFQFEELSLLFQFRRALLGR